MNVISNNSLQCTIALAALEEVLDPEMGINVVDLGLINQIDFDSENNRVCVEMTLTTQFCPMGESITQAVKNRLSTIFENQNIEVSLSFDPPWNHERISEQGLRFLNE